MKETITKLLKLQNWLPSSFLLQQNYHNSFNPSTTILYELPEQSLVTIKVFNILGQEVAQFANNKQQEAGDHSVTLDGSSLTSGVYFYRMTAVSGKQTFT